MEGMISNVHLQQVRCFPTYDYRQFSDMVTLRLRFTNQSLQQQTLRYTVTSVADLIHPFQSNHVIANLLLPLLLLRNTRFHPTFFEQILHGVKQATWQAMSFPGCSSVEVVVDVVISPESPLRGLQFDEIVDDVLVFADHRHQTEQTLAQAAQLRAEGSVVKEEVYNKLKSVVFGEETERIINDACSICFEAFEHGMQLKKMPECEHGFHEHCVLPWLRKNKRSCPTCRSNF